jgi:methionyl-tRNA synthetase
MQKKEPWILDKINKGLEKEVTAGGSISPEYENNKKIIDNTLHLCLQLTANLAILINPFLPSTAKKLCHMMKVVEKLLDWENAGKMKLLSVGYNLRPPELLFRKIEDAEIEAQMEKLKNKSQKAREAEKMEKTGTTQNEQPVAEPVPAVAVKPEIVFDDFAKIDLRVGTIITAEKVEKADKLLKLTIDLGFETRTIVSGIALHFKPEEIVGKQVTVVANLAPRKMRGIESNGMILMAEDKSGKLYFVNPDEKVEAGSGVS